MSCTCHLDLCLTSLVMNGTFKGAFHLQFLVLNFEKYQICIWSVIFKIFFLNKDKIIIENAKHIFVVLNVFNEKLNSLKTIK